VGVGAGGGGGAACPGRGCAAGRRGSAPGGTGVKALRSAQRRARPPAWGSSPLRPLLTLAHSPRLAHVAQLLTVSQQRLHVAQVAWQICSMDLGFCGHQPGRTSGKAGRLVGTSAGWEGRRLLWLAGRRWS
jgi:hypothetical protein